MHIQGVGIQPGYMVTGNPPDCQCGPYSPSFSDIHKAPKGVLIWVGLAFALGVLVGK